jgi:hypothetical protein
MEQGKADRREAPLRPKHVWTIRRKLQIEGRARRRIAQPFGKGRLGELSDLN